MNDSTYRLLSSLFDAFLWGGELCGTENLPESGPAVFVSNHLGATGPVAVVASLPIRVYPWVISDMLDKGKAADYLRIDFVEPQLHLSPPTSIWVAKMLSKVSTRLLLSAGCIAVYQGKRLLDTYQTSVDILEDGRFILVFPEDPEGELDPISQMRPFKKGFTRLGEYYYARTNQLLPFYPLAVHHDSYQVQVGEPELFNARNPLPNERLRIKKVIEASIREMYIAMATDNYLGVPLHQ